MGKNTNQSAGKKNQEQQLEQGRCPFCQKHLNGDLEERRERLVDIGGRMINKKLFVEYCGNRGCSNGMRGIVMNATPELQIAFTKRVTVQVISFIWNRHSEGWDPAAIIRKLHIMEVFQVRDERDVEDICTTLTVWKEDQKPALAVS